MLTKVPGAEEGRAMSDAENKVRIHCPMCGGGPQELTTGNRVTCVDCRCTMLVTPVYGMSNMVIGLTIRVEVTDGQATESD